MKTLLPILCLALLAGCGGGKLWTLQEQGDAWPALGAADSAGVAPFKVPEGRAVKESRPDDWATSWPVDGASEFAEGMTDADAGLQASSGDKGDLRVSVEVVEIYNGDGYSYFGSNSARMTLRARITNAAGEVVAVLTAADTMGDYKGTEPFVLFAWRFGHDLAEWIAAHR